MNHRSSGVTVRTAPDEAPLPLLSVSATARRLGVHRNSVRRLIRAGELPHVRIGKRILLEPADVEQLIADNRRVGTAA
jgi:excisionase family DNA binding protein